MAGGIRHPPAYPSRERDRMSTLSSASTLKQVRDAWEDNASYAEDASPAKCRLFITASMILLGRQPQVSALGSGQVGERLELNQEMLKGLLDDARRWLEANGPALTRGSGVTLAKLGGFRA